MLKKDENPSRSRILKIDDTIKKFHAILSALVSGTIVLHGWKIKSEIWYIFIVYSVLVIDFIKNNAL